jgi:UDP-2-acetamido-3-amino-2,3-dideoxy-glucuronate N-acetyltransferase
VTKIYGWVEKKMKKVAVIGAGYWGKNLVRSYYKLGALKTVCDANPATLIDLKKDLEDLNTTESFETVLNDRDIKAVIISLPSEFHFEYAKKALLFDKDVFVEKPLALKLSHAEELNEIARTRSRILMVGHLLHYHPAFIKLKEIVDNGSLGRIQYIYSNRLSFGKIRREENTLWSFAPHDISMILSICNEIPSTVSAIGHNYLHNKIADVTTTHITFPSGINSHIFVSWLHPFKEQKLVIVATEKMAVFEDTQPWERKLALYSHHIKWDHGLPIPDKGEPEYIPVTISEPLLAECGHFLECIEKRSTPVTDGKEGYRVLEVLTRAQNSLENNGISVSVSGGTVNDYYVHESAYIDQPSTIGKGTKIWHFSHIQKNSSIGTNCIIGQNVNIAGDVVIGNNVKIQNNVSLYTGVIIEDDVFLGPSSVFTNVINPRSQINRHSLYEKTIIKKGATIGANATIVCGITIGMYAFVAAGAVITNNIPDYALMMGVPAHQCGWMSRHGVKLTDPDPEGIYTCKESGLRYTEVQEGVLRCLDLDEIDVIPEQLSVGTKSYRQFK